MKGENSALESTKGWTELFRNWLCFT